MKPIHLIPIALLLAGGVYLTARLGSAPDAPSPDRQLPASSREADQPSQRKEMAKTPAERNSARMKPIREALIEGHQGKFNESFAALAQADPEAAAAFLDKTAPFRQDAMRILAQAWADKDAAAACKWAAALPDSADGMDALDFIFFQVAIPDPGRAVKLAMEQQAGDQRGTMSNLAQQWAAKDFPAAVAWAESLVDETLRNAVFSRLAMVRADTDPDAAARLVISELPAGPAQDEAAMSVLNRWLQSDATAATAWVAGFPDTELKTRAEKEIANFRESATAR